MLTARVVASYRSKDPNTKVGSVVYDPISGSMHVGYNGFLPGVLDLKARWDNRDSQDPDSKYSFVVHAERNALSKAVKLMGEQVSRCWLFCTHFPCHICMRDWVAQLGLHRVYYANPYPEDNLSFVIAASMLIELVHLPLKNVSLGDI